LKEAAVADFNVRTIWYLSRVQENHTILRMAGYLSRFKLDTIKADYGCPLRTIVTVIVMVIKRKETRLISDLNKNKYLPPSRKCLH
jgi:hypothetical protein